PPRAAPARPSPTRKCRQHGRRTARVCCALTPRWRATAAPATPNRLRASSADPDSAQLDPARRVVARAFLAAHPAVDPGFDELARERLVQQQVVDAQPRVALPVVAEVVPEGVDGFVGMELADRVGPALLQEALPG